MSELSRHTGCYESIFFFLNDKYLLISRPGKTDFLSNSTDINIQGVVEFYLLIFQEKIMDDREILEYLAETMSFVQTLEQFPGLTVDKLRFLMKKYLVEPVQSSTVEYEPDSTSGEKPIELNIYIDGASSGNPGHAGFGIVVCNSRNEILTEFSQYIGKNTSNYAEYKALIYALHLAKDFKATGLNVFSDSQLVVRQITGQYKVKNPQLYELYEQATRMIKKIAQFSIMEIPREKNKIADKLATGAIKIHKAKMKKREKYSDDQFKDIIE